MNNPGVELPTKDESEKTFSDRVFLRAYELWQREGCPHGRDVDHWVQAEREIAEEQRQTSGPKPK